MIHYLKTIKDWFSTLFHVVNNYRELKVRVHNLEVQHSKLTRVLRERTQVNVEASPHPQAPHNVIVTGRYKNKDYVEIFTVRTEHLHDIIRELKAMQDHAQIRHIDTGSHRHMRRVFDEELDI